MHFVATGCAVIATLLPQAQTPDLKPMYSKRSAAIRSGNLKSFFSIYDPNYTSIDLHGRKMEMPEMREGWIPLIKSKEFRLDLVDLVVESSDKKQTTVRATITMHLPNPSRDLKVLSQDTWQNTPSGWHLVATRMLKPTN